MLDALPYVGFVAEFGSMKHLIGVKGVSIGQEGGDINAGVVVVAADASVGLTLFPTDGGWSDVSLMDDSSDV